MFLGEVKFSIQSPSSPLQLIHHMPVKTLTPPETHQPEQKNGTSATDTSNANEDLGSSRDSAI